MALLDAISATDGNNSNPALAYLYDEAVRDTVARFDATGSPIITDGEQRKLTGDNWTCRRKK